MAALASVGFVAAFGVVFWATWSALPHHAALASPAPPKLLPVEALGVACWVISGAYGATVAVTGRRWRGVPRWPRDGRVRAWGAAEAVLAGAASWLIVTQPAASAAYTFSVAVGVFGLGTGLALALRRRAAGG